MGFYKDEDPIVCDGEDSEWVSCDVRLLALNFLLKPT